MNESCSPKLSKSKFKRIVDGKITEEAAREAFLNGILIETTDTRKALEKTKLVVAEEAPILYETALSLGGVYVRTDIIKRESMDAPWDLCEIMP